MGNTDRPFRFDFMPQQQLHTIKKVIVYCRVSDPSQVSGTSLKNQQESCIAFAKRKLNVSDDEILVFIEEGESATTANRTEFLKAINYCKENKDRVTAFVVWKLDRFSRSITDHYAVKAKLTQYGVTLHSVEDPITDTPEGKLMEALIAGFGEFENSLRKQRCHGGMAQRIKSGIRPGKPPLGYLHSKDRLDKKKTKPDLPDPERFHLVQRLFKTYAYGGITLSRLAEQATSWGLKTRTGKPINDKFIDYTLRNKFYAGILTDPWTGEEYTGQHEPVITIEEFQKIQLIKLQNSRVFGLKYRNMNPDFPLRRFVRCSSCGGIFTGSWRTGGSGIKHDYYCCRNKSCEHYTHGISRPFLESKFLELLSQYTPTIEFLTLFKAAIVDVWKTSHADFKKARIDYESQLKKLEEKKKHLTQMRADQELSKDEFLSMKAEVENEITAIQISCNEAQIEEFDAEANLEYCSQFMCDLPRQWTDMNIEHRVEMQSLVFPQGLLYDKTAGKFGTAVLSPIFALNQLSREGKSHLVAGTRVARVISWL